METKHIDRLKLIVWGEQDKLQDKLIEEMKSIKIICQKAKSGDDWVHSLQKEHYHAGAIILNSENFSVIMNLAQKLRLTNKTIPLFIFAASKEDNSLLTEAEENGFNDHFFLPIDLDLLATKLGRYFFQNDLQKRQLEQSTVPKERALANIHLKCHVVSVDENGMTLRGPHMLTKGAEIKMRNSDILFFLGYGEISLVVEKSWVEDDNTFSAYAEWKNNPEEMANAVRKWSLENKR